MGIRSLLVDDEEIARRGLRIRLERAGDIEIIGECANAGEAARAMERLSPDLVFLDIQMPEMSGIELVQSLLPRATPHIVFVTAFDRYAVDAFEVHALDYLLKPIDDDRLAETLRRARAAVVTRHDGAYLTQVIEAFAKLGNRSVAHAVPGADRIVIPDGDRLTLVRIAEIDWIEAAGNYVSVHVGKTAKLLRETVSAMDDRLTPHGFIRIHRRTLVNAQRVCELQSSTNGEFEVVLSDGTRLKLSRGYRDALDQLIGRRR